MSALLHARSLHNSGDQEGVAELFALLVLQTASRGQAGQDSVVEHFVAHAEAYSQLLAAHSSNQHVSAVLHLLTTHGQLEDSLPKAPKAVGYLQLLTALARQLGPQLADAQPEGLLELVTSLFASMKGAMAAIERDLRTPAVASVLDGSSCGQQLTDRQKAQVDCMVRNSLPQSALSAALCTLAVVPTRQLLVVALSGSLSPLSRQRRAVQLLVSMLQLELLWCRLPPQKRRPSVTLDQLMEHRELIGGALHQALLTLGLDVTGGSIASSARALPLLSLVLALLRAAAKSFDNQLRPPLGIPPQSTQQGAQQQQSFAHALLQLQPSGKHIISNLQLVAILLMSQHGLSCQGGSISHRKACDLLLWCLKPPSHLGVHLQALVQHAAAALPLKQLIEQVKQQHAFPQPSRHRNPYCLEVAQALLQSSQADHGTVPAHLADLHAATTTAMANSVALQQSFRASLPQAESNKKANGVKQPGLDAMDRIPAPPAEQRKQGKVPPRAAPLLVASESTATDIPLPPASRPSTEQSAADEQAARLRAELEALQAALHRKRRPRAAGSGSEPVAAELPGSVHDSKAGEQMAAQLELATETHQGADTLACDAATQPAATAPGHTEQASSTTTQRTEPMCQQQAPLVPSLPARDSDGPLAHRTMPQPDVQKQQAPSRKARRQRHRELYSRCQHDEAHTQKHLRSQKRQHVGQQGQERCHKRFSSEKSDLSVSPGSSDWLTPAGPAGNSAAQLAGNQAHMVTAHPSGDMDVDTPENTEDANMEGVQD